MRNIFILVVLVFSSGFFVTPALAAVIKIDSDFKSLHVGDVFTVLLSVDTENQTVNAIETEIIFPQEILEYVSTDDGESGVSLWVLQPAYDGLGSVSLSGITPGGFSNQNTEILTLKFRAKKEGQGNIISDKTKLLLHDGLGTEALLVKQNLHITVNSGQSEIMVNTVDDEMPESFTPEIIQDTDIFANRSTLIFATKDKGSGMDHFEVREGWFSRYQVAESPYELKNQTLDKKIQVKAIDRAGNERIETIYPQNWQPWNERPSVIVSILVLCVLSLFIFWKFFRARGIK